MAKQVIVDQRLLNKLINYVYGDEAESCEEMERENGSTKGHIFHIIEKLQAQANPKPVVVAEVVAAGELEIETGTVQQDLISQAGDLLDSACSHDILGTVLFKGKDGKYYTMSTECSIYPASPAYVKMVKDEQAE